MNSEHDYIENHLRDQISSLEKKLRDAHYFLSQLADEIQYQHGFNDSAYKKCVEAMEDETKWSI